MDVSDLALGQKNRPTLPNLCTNKGYDALKLIPPAHNPISDCDNNTAN